MDTDDFSAEAAPLLGPLQSYVSQICVGILSCGLPTELSASDKDLLIKFIATDTSLLYVEKTADEDLPKMYNSVKASTRTLSSVAFVKLREAPLDKKSPISQQLQIMTLGAEKDMYSLMQQYTRHSFAPLVRIAGSHIQASDTTSTSDNLSVLNRRIRELDLALEQCQRGSVIPKVELQVPAVIEKAALKTTAGIVRGLLEKYNPSQADALFSEVQLSASIGTTAESNEAFASDISKSARTWPADIQRQCRFIDIPFPSTAEREIMFWNDLEKKLMSTKELLGTPGVLLTKLALKRTNRVSEQLIREAELELEKALEVTQASVSFFSDFKIEELMSAADFPQVTKAVTNCLQYFTRIRHSKYDFTRVIRLLEVFGVGLFEKMASLLKDKNVMRCNLDDFQLLKGNCDLVFAAWETHFAGLRSVLKDVAKRRSEKIKTITFEHEVLQKRINAIADFREQHDRLLTVFSTVLSGEENTVLTDLSEAYKLMLREDNDVLDVSNDGQTSWSVSVQMYEKRISKTEERIIRILEERLSTARSADDMFHVFGVFSPLFFRPAIRNAVNSFRASLVHNVREDVKRLQDKFTLRYDDSKERATADLRDIPPVAGRIIWARQIEVQLTTLMKRMEDVLGAEGWENYQEGRQLREVCNELRGYLDIEALYKDWLNNQLKAESVLKFSKSSDFVLLIEDDHRGIKVLKVNFDPKQVILFKEVRYLEGLLVEMKMNKPIPATIKTLANEAYARYPISLALEAALSGFAHAKQSLNPHNMPLLVTHLNAVRDSIKEAIGGSAKSKKWIKWDSSDLNEWVGRLSHKVYAFQERVDDICEKLDVVDSLLLQLQNCQYDRETFEQIMSELQVVIDDTRMRGYSNVQAWVTALDNRVDSIITDRLQRGINTWVQVFRGVPPEENEEQMRSEDMVLLPMSLHEILISNQKLFVSPPLEQSRVEWIEHYHSHISVIASLPRIVSSKFDVFAETTDVPTDYSSLLKKLEPELARKAYMEIEKYITLARNFAQEWLQYQTLWDVSLSVITEHCGPDMARWQSLLSEIRTARSSLDNADEETVFGPIVINFRQVQNKIISKYDVWQKEAQTQFGGMLEKHIKELGSELTASKSKLEGTYMDGSPQDIIEGIHTMNKLKNNLTNYKSLVGNYEQGEKLLQKQRYKFPDGWLSASSLSNTLNDLHQIYVRRAAFLEKETPSLMTKVQDEDKAIAARVSELYESWNEKKPEAGAYTPDEAVRIISAFQAQATKLKEEQETMASAKLSLGLDSLPDERAGVLLMQIEELKESWTSLFSSMEKLGKIRKQKFRDIDDPVQIRKQLDEITEDLRLLPAKVRGYASYDSLYKKITEYLSYGTQMRDMGDKALQDRHWRKIMAFLGIGGSPNDLTLGALWDCDIEKHHKEISEIVAGAQGEFALDQFIGKIKDYWTTAELALVARENLTIITDWDKMFNTIEDDLSSLHSMKQSPYFAIVKQFQEEAATWESKITALRSILTVWVEVQRKWLYLRGIFRNEDIKLQLPTQHANFKSVDTELVTLMKRVAGGPSCLGLLQYDNLNKQLERCDATMVLIQKGLIEYLDAQRQIFPRYYFVNNNDLVEIIGNANEPAKVVSHLGEMFAGIVNVVFSTTRLANKNCIDKISSKEGEVIGLSGPVDVGVTPTAWLGALEAEMITSLAVLLQKCMASIPSTDVELIKWVDSFPAQTGILASQVAWCQSCETSLNNSSMDSVLTFLVNRLKALSEGILRDMTPSLRKKCEQIITEVVHQRDVTRLLIATNVTSNSSFGWRYHLRLYWDKDEAELAKKISIKMSNASFFYGFEYQGIGERLVQTPLTDRCYLTLTQALHLRLGGNCNGPAGTGKTESVKMLGSQLGRLVLVFNCDENFDYAAMGRIFAGLCRVGAWGCFDEFNRLEARILSAVSQQILNIQKGLINKSEFVELMGMEYKLNKDVGIFITMNPGYAGRSELPDNLKQLFRAVTMAVPDLRLITQVLLFSQGIISAEALAGKTVLLFTLCFEQLSTQSHYDFGLRALKSVLTGAGELKRIALNDKNRKGMEDLEMDVLMRSLCNSILPKLVSQDVPLFTSLFQSVFPGQELPKVLNVEALVSALKGICDEDSFAFEGQWADKVLQLKQVLDVRHGVMLVGPSGTGKTSAWRSLIKALTKVDGVKGDFYVIDPKAISKTRLYGHLDPNTLEWTDGVFTKLLRKFIDASAAGNTARRSWIVFDGDVDPEWAENLNSVLDDNKVLTLPSGDRLKIPNNVRIMFEVDTLKYATLATVSRCGMIWFPEGTIPLKMALVRQVKMLKSYVSPSTARSIKASVSSSLIGKFVDAIASKFEDQGLVMNALQYSLAQTHIMTTSVERLITTLHSFLIRGIELVLDHDDMNSSGGAFSHLSTYAGNWLLYSLQWAFGGSMKWNERNELSLKLAQLSGANLGGNNLIDLKVSVTDGHFNMWSTIVPRVDLPASKVSTGDVVIPTTDTVRHTDVLTAWIQSRKPLLLCGPPGSGKTMTLTAVIQAMPNVIVAQLDFSSSTTPDLILKVFLQYCEIIDSPEGLALQPNHESYSDDKWLIVFCDEINLPETDKYGTQKVIMFIRQLTEQGGFWNNECKWIILKRIQFIGACNPPTDTGRVALSPRFLRHASLLLVDYPSAESLHQIYFTFNKTIVRNLPNLKGSVEALTGAMVDVYMANHDMFKPEVQPQYIYSPRELSRWVRALHEGVEPQQTLTYEELVRLWANIAYHLFQDRLVTDEERSWCDQKIKEVATKHFKGVDLTKSLAKPIMYTNWLTGQTESCKIDDLRAYLKGRLKTFYEEELDVPLVIFDDVIEHVIRIDSVLKNPLGHLLLVGESGVGKTVLSKFVAWLNQLAVFQVKASSKYTIHHFDEDLRSLFRRVGVEGEKICFIFDESNVLSSAFLERMNALLASGEVPGLFEGDDRAMVLSACRDSYVQKEGLVLSSDDDCWRHFTKCIQRNLHVVFTMNPANTDFNNRCTTSPALFNRCVVDWFGTWSEVSLSQVAFDFISNLNSSLAKFSVPAKNDLYRRIATLIDAKEGAGMREAVVAAFISIFEGVKGVCEKLGKSLGRKHYVSPRDFIDMVNKFNAVLKEKHAELTEQQKHIKNGLSKLEQTQTQVSVMQKDMERYSVLLKDKEREANDKLNQVVEKQKEAMTRKEAAEKLTAKLKAQTKDLDARRAIVQKDLDLAAPALNSAQEGVKNIRKAEFNEVKTLATPPKIVQLVMELVIVLIGEKQKDWNSIKKVIRGDDFLTSILNYDPNILTLEMIEDIKTNYANNPELNQEAVNRGSKACAPLYSWALSQVAYSEIVMKLKPLNMEIAELSKGFEVLAAEQAKKIKEVEELEAIIEAYKAEYSAAIRESSKVKADMEAAQKKTIRAEALLGSLAGEKERWIVTSNNFDAEMSTIGGDCLLSAAFLTFGGIFDQTIREMLIRDWTAILTGLNLMYKKSYDVVNYLTSPSNLPQWASHGLSSDTLSIQNAVLLERFSRYPLIVDPSGQATAFVLSKFSARKIANSSFVEPQFLKVLTTAVRFGTPLLARDCEYFDPILNPILNKEVQRVGGRSLVRIGSDEVDFSPMFFIILATKDPLAHFPPDLCSRVTMINFTVTSSSLTSQTLGNLLRSERPDVEMKRVEIMRLLIEQNVRLRELEQSILSRLGELKGAILDDDSFLSHLESTKQQAAEITEEVANSDKTMADIGAVLRQYEPLAQMMTSTFFSLSALAYVSPLYQFSLDLFFEIVDNVLMSMSRDVGEDKLDNLKICFVKEVSRRVMKSLKYRDQLLLAVKMALSAVQGDPAASLTSDEMSVLYHGQPAKVVVTDTAKYMKENFAGALPGVTMTDTITKGLIALHSLEAFKGLSASVAEKGSGKSAWANFFDNAFPEKNVPMTWSSGTLNKSRESLLKLLIVRCLTPSRIVAALDIFINETFNNNLRWRDDSLPQIRRIATVETKSPNPILLCCGTGQDASSKVTGLAKDLGKELLEVSMGSKEGFEQADKSLVHAAKAGCWVLLRNVHLCTEWLVSLDKRLQSMTLAADFRLFLTSDISDTLPTELVKRSDVAIYEASTGIKANLLRFFNSISASRIESKPTQRVRLYALLGWLDAVVQERLRYAPLGWSKRYEFSDSDAKCSLDIIDEWLNELIASKAQITPETLPWDALKVSLSQSYYGGRVDNRFDQAALDSFIDFVFSPASFAASAPLAVDYSAKGRGAALVTLPNGLEKTALDDWISKLPDISSTEWLGLPASAENQLQSELGLGVLSTLMKLSTEDVDNAALSKSGNDGAESSVTVLGKTIEKWIAALPVIAASADKTSDVSLTSIERCLTREVTVGVRILNIVRNDLQQVLLFTKGTSPSTNRIREVIGCCNKQEVPKEWTVGFPTSPSVPLGAWISELILRTNGLNSYKDILAKKSSKCTFVIGRMFSPESFITATRQMAAQANKWSLDDVELFLEIQSGTSEGVQDSVVDGLQLVSATWSGTGLELQDQIFSALPVSRLRWKLKGDGTKSDIVTLPVYLDSTRKMKVTEVLVRVPANIPKYVWAQRGVAVLLDTN